ncbi:hypothetical protein [Epilithonimonas lactis]|uniref:Uncharacterized protein n=1 Tax=Epilithonimonas lactis TaxID=421072 RepID=A0A085BJW1_9FLAO|nr:hypothetical protein [Epilithonimonas lactis]KFC22756.1 hypothetical protein IO89_06800 [Epilithonimonas lactis]SEQ86324.1 hypothetical protein SAMN04488097_3279 [Epilithonimonas lactis]
MDLEQDYQVKLDFVRKNRELLENYRFEKEASNSKQFDRLRLNIAIYNDLKSTDFEIVKFLFNQEREWRKYGKDGDVDNLYFSAFILTLFNSPEVIWQLCETKSTDFDSSIGFDGEHFLTSGIEKTYEYLESVDHPLKFDLLDYIGLTEYSCKYSQEQIDEWKKDRISYFINYKFPIRDELDFLYATNEKELFVTKFLQWIKQKKNWTSEELALYRTYAKYLEDKASEIEALKLIIEKNDNDFMMDIYNLSLSELYIEVCDYNKSFEIISELLHSSPNKNIIRDGVHQLCTIIIKKNIVDDMSRNIFNTISRQKKKYKNFSPLVDDLINEVIALMKRQGYSEQKNKLQRSKTSWWKRLFK